MCKEKERKKALVFIEREKTITPQSSVSKKHAKNTPAREKRAKKTTTKKYTANRKEAEKHNNFRDQNIGLKKSACF